MKGTKHLFVLWASISILMACSKEESTKPAAAAAPVVSQPPVATVQEFEAEIDGVVYTADSIVGAISGNVFFVKGYKDGDSMTVSTTDPQPGTYRGTTDGKNAVSYYTNGLTLSSNFNSPVNSIITITSYDAAAGLISGTFESTVKHIPTQTVKSIQKGSFKNIQVEKVATANYGTMSASINGFPFQSYACIGLDQFGTKLVTGSNAGATQSITIQFINGYPSLGTHSLDDDTYITFFSNINGGLNPNFTYSSSNWGPNFIEGGGSIEITKLNLSQKVIEGKFDFKGYNFSMDSVQVSNGLFSAAIQ